VLCISGLDPTGGAGLQADIETVAALGCHALGIVTVLTAQDSRDVRWVDPVDASRLADQLAVLLADCAPAAVKLGLIGNTAQLRVIATAIAGLGVPMVCDPVLRAGGGTDLVDEDYAAALRSILLPQVSVLTPNAAEARRLVPDAIDLEAAARVLVSAGCGRVLITGGDEPGDRVSNVCFGADAAVRRYDWPRLPETFHGAGCTLASAIAARLALGDDIDTAIETAQMWTQQSLQRAFAVGSGRRIPGRLPR
jgi:hydroxymethylpyrimidine/phosphomethylpyrimidine kinase